MVRSKRNLLAAAETSSSPPNALPEGHEIARVVKAAGNNLYEVENGLGGKTLVEMHSRLRSTIWVKRGSFVVVDRHSLALRDNKLGGEIVNVVSNEKAWRRESYWWVQVRWRN